jgi:hypothetical protein
MLRQLSEEHDLTPWFEDGELLAEVLEPEEGNTDPDDVPDDVIVKRWENFTGKKAMLEESKEAF